MNIIVVGDVKEGKATTANALAEGFAALGGHEVAGYPEMAVDTWRDLANPDHLDGVDLIVWSRSRSLSGRFDMHAMLAAARTAGTGTVAVHLDRWWGLAREREVAEEPFFRCDLVCTTDGGNDDRWDAAGVRHRWLPPAVTAADAALSGRFHPAAANKAVFVGSWHAYAHPEWRHRGALIKRLARRFGPRLVTFPGADGRRVQGQELADILASAAIVVGDSALVGGTGRYWSDRVPITLGMGGLLVHPTVEGMDEQGLVAGEHFLGAPVGDIDALGDVVAAALAGEYQGTEVRSAGREAVLAEHTYTVRAQRIIDLYAGNSTSSSSSSSLSGSSDSTSSSTLRSSSSDSAASPEPSPRSVKDPARSGRSALAALPGSTFKL